MRWTNEKQIGELHQKIILATQNHMRAT